MEHLSMLERRGAMWWRPDERAWTADPAEVVKALTEDGFREYTRHVARGGRTRVARGGRWQGLDPRTGTVACVIWVMHTMPPDVHVFIEVEGRWVEGAAFDPGPGGVEARRRRAWNIS
jgi:hypothetical protein